MLYKHFRVVINQRATLQHRAEVTGSETGNVLYNQPLAEQCPANPPCTGKPSWTLLFHQKVQHNRSLAMVATSASTPHCHFGGV